MSSRVSWARAPRAPTADFRSIVPVLWKHGGEVKREYIPGWPSPHSALASVSVWRRKRPIPSFPQTPHPPSFPRKRESILPTQPQGPLHHCAPVDWIRGSRTLGKRYPERKAVRQWNRARKIEWIEKGHPTWKGLYNESDETGWIPAFAGMTRGGASGEQ